MGPADAAQRGCLIVKRADEYLAVISDPFKTSIRGWLELKVSQPLVWHLAAAGEIAAYIAKHEQDLRAMDVAQVEAVAAAQLGVQMENLSLATISASPRTASAASRPS